MDGMSCLCAPVAVQFTAALRSFRPSATVLEAEIAGVKSAGALVGSGGQVLEVSRKNTNDVMQRKRATHAAVIEKERKKKLVRAKRGEGSWGLLLFWGVAVLLLGGWWSYMCLHAGAVAAPITAASMRSVWRTQLRMSHTL